MIRAGSVRVSPAASPGALLLVLLAVVAALLVAVPPVVPSASAAVVVPEVVSFNPFRAADTRSGLGVRAGAVVAGGTLEVPVAGVRGVPATASAIALNVTVASPASAGDLTVFPCGVARPATSTLNYAASQAVGNAVFSKVGAGGKVCVYTKSQAHLIVDVADYWPAGSAFTGITPVRAADTRNGTGVRSGVIPAGGTLQVPLAGRLGVPSDAKGVAFNLTAAAPAVAGALTIYPCGATRPTTTALSYAAGRTIASAVLSKTGTGGSVCLYATTATHVVLDLTGYLPAASVFSGITPIRAADTRSGSGVRAGVIPAGGTLEVPVAGRFGLPSGAGAVSASVTAIGPQAGGDLTVFPCGNPKPTASTLNHIANQTVSNAVLARIGTGGKICIQSKAATHVTVDLNGYYKGVDTGAGATAVTAGGGLNQGDFTVLGGGGHSCALMPGGYVKCWGDNSSGQLGDDTTSSRSAPVQASGITGATAVDAGWDYTCAIVSGGVVKCWGSGFGAAPVSIPGITGAAAISDRCAIVAGAVKCWDTVGHVPAAVSGISGATAISVGNDSSNDMGDGSVACAIVALGAVKCWYGDEWGGTPLGGGTATTIAGISGATAITASSRASCALVAGGAVKCWDQGNVPAAVPGISGATAVVATSNQNSGVGGFNGQDSHACVLVAGAVKCFDPFNAGGTLRTGVTGLVSFADSGRHKCAVVAGGSVKCWGNDAYGNLGNGTVNGAPPAAVKVTGMSNATKVANGADNSCAIVGGAVKCWGGGWSYADTMTGMGRFAPVDAGFSAGATAIAFGEAFRWEWGSSTAMCAITSGGAVQCAYSTSPPVSVAGISGATAVSLGGGYRSSEMDDVSRHVCAVVVGGAVKCAGDNSYGQLGDGTFNYSEAAVTVRGISGAVDVDAGVGASCAKLSTGVVKCWGDGYGTTPVTRPGPWYGEYDSGRCAVVAGGAVQCAGDNIRGQLGVNPGWVPVTALL